MAPVVNGWVSVAGGEGRYQLVGIDLFAEALFRSHLAEVSDRAGFTSDWLTRPGALLLSAATAATRRTKSSRMVLLHSITSRRERP